MDVVAETFGSYSDRTDDAILGLNVVAVELGVKVLKVRKLLIKTGAYSTALS